MYTVIAQKNTSYTWISIEKLWLIQMTNEIKNFRRIYI